MIGVFNNNMNPRVLAPASRTHNKITTCNFETGAFGEIFADAMQREDVRTHTEGVFSILPGGKLLVEEENFGRLLIFTPDEQVAAEYVNAADDGKVYRLGWSRYVSADQMQKIFEAVEGKTFTQ